MPEYIKKTEDGKLMLSVDSRIYSKKAIASALYIYTGDYYVYESLNPNDDSIIDISFEGKNGKSVSENIVKDFCNDLLDQQVRCDVTEQFGHIRDLIVEEAFKPLEK